MPFTGEAKRAYQREWMRRRRAEWIAENGPCARCGSGEQLDVDHIDPGTKCMNPRALWSLTAAKRVAELAKCQVLCRTCHTTKSVAEREVPIPPHGTYARYRRKDVKCRCDTCKTANREYMRSWRSRHTS